MATMTEREFLTAILAIDGIAPDLADHASASIAKLDAKNAKRKTTETKEQKENKELMSRILTLLADGAMIAKDLASALEVSTSKVSALCTKLKAEGLITSVEVKNGKSKCQQYSLVPSETAPTAE